MFNSTKPRSKPVVVLLLPLLLAAVAATGLGTASAHDTPAVQHPTQFTDVHSDSFYVTAVDWMVQNEITTGTSATTFHPERNVTRGEAAAFLWRLSCRPQPADPHSFSDVHADWQQQPVGWLQQHGAAPVQGTGTEPADVYGPSTLLTRAQIAALLYQLFSDGTQPETVSPFVDVTEPWQTAPVLWLLANQVTTGTSDTTFHPDRNVTRGEFATFLWRHSQQPDPADRSCQPPPCGAGLVKLDEFVTETDNGCRTANCVYGRNATGHCRSWQEWRQAELERDCPTVDTSDGLGAMGEASRNGLLPPPTFPKLVPGSSWIAEISLVDNRHWPPDGIMPDYFDGDAFIAYLYVPISPGQAWFMDLVRTDDVDGNWTVQFAVNKTPFDDPFELWVTASGSGCWAVRFARAS